jgi:serine/threonine protein kinase
MAYLEVRKAGKLVKRRLVEDDRAQKGCRIRVGSAGQVRLRMGESKTLGKYTVSMLEGAPPDDGPDLLNQSEMKSDSFPAMSETEQAGFTGPAQVGSHGGQSPTPVIEDYEVTGRLGQGGMGTVWRAVQLSTKREVALKFLGKHRFASKRSRARFEREVSLAAKLTHPNIACVYDSGLHRGVYYYAMELVDGVHLDKYVHQNQLSHREILKLMKDVCNAVGYAHEKGIIHRDLKPSNILVTNDGRPHVVDFGLAKASMDEDDLTISIDGEITGTLAYMSPEQAAGRLDKIGAPTDVYSLGVILHQLLTGRLPHDVTGSRYDVIKRIVEEDVQSPRAHDDSIDGDLESLILAALAQEPEDRYPSAILLLNDIENYLNREPLLARSMSATYRIRKRVRKYATRIARSLLFITILAVVVVSAYYLVSSERKKRFEAEKLAGLRQDQTDTLESSELIGNEDNLIDGSGGDETGERIAKQNIMAWSPKRAPAPSAIKVEGKPFFVICARSAVPSEYGEYKKDGFNTVSTHDSDNPALDEAQKYGLKAISRLPWFKLHSEWGFMKDNVFTEADWETFEQQVEHQSKHPALFAWALPTGVVVHKFSSDDIQRAYNMVKNAAPSKPAFSLFAIGNLTRNTAKSYLQYTDVMFTENANRDLKQFGRNLEKSVTLGNGRPAWHVIHGHRGHYGDNQPVTLRSQCYVAVNHGITGIFIDGFKEKLWEEWGESNVRGMGDPENKDLCDQAKRLAGELSILSEPILAGALLDEVTITNDNGNIDFKAYLHPNNNSLYIIAVNTSKTEVKPTFIIPGFVQSRINLIGETRQIEPLNGQFSDIFEPYHTHLYVLRTENVPKQAIQVESPSEQVVSEPVEQWIPKRTLPPVSIEVNGKPFFAICARSCEPNDFAEIAKAGFNVVSSHNAANAYLEDAKRYGLRAIAYTGQDPERQALEKRARSLQNDKTLLAWFMPSCPIAHKIHRGSIRRTYEQIYTNDKNHPVLIDFAPSQSSWQQVKSYSPLCDIVAIEPFIYTQNSSVIKGLDIRDRVLAVSHWTDRARKEIAVDKPLWVLIQAFATKGGTGMRPTPQQFRAMAYLAINHGATGITVSGFKKRLWQEDGYDVMGLGDPQMHELKQTVLRVAGEIKQLSPAILAGAVLDEVTIKNDDGKIDFKSYLVPDSKGIHLIAVNTSDTEVQPTFVAPNMRGNVHILNEPRDIPLPDGQFSDKFEAYQTHIYDIRMKQDLLQGSSEKTNVSEIIDPKGNLMGNTQKTYLDIIKASVYEEGDNCVLTVTTTDGFPAPKQLGADDTFTFIWFVDIDRNRATGQTREGNDYNIRLWCSNKRTWSTSWFNTTEASKRDGIKVDLKKIIINVQDNAAMLIFPKYYLPSDQFDWWVNSGTRPNNFPSATRNPPTQRGTFKRSLSGR